MDMAIIRAQYGDADTGIPRGKQSRRRLRVTMASMASTPDVPALYTNPPLSDG